MFVIAYITFHLMILSFVDNPEGLTTRRGCDNILKTELEIRTTTNKLFSILKLKNVREKKLKQYTILHNYFVSLALQDHFAFKTITEISDFNKGIDNATKNFIGLINEILDSGSEDRNENSTRVVSVTANLVNYLDNFLDILLNLHNTHEAHASRGFKVNEEVLRILGESESAKNTSLASDAHENYEVLKESEYWVPRKSAELLNSRRIFQGKNVKVKYFPFFASVHVLGQFQCGASIIKEDLVITASSCLQLLYNNRLYRENPSMLAVRVGSHFYRGGGELIAIHEVYFHPQYNPRTLSNNLAIMRLGRVLHFNPKTALSKKWKIKIIDTDTAASPLPANTLGVTIIGFGANSMSGTFRNPWNNRLSYAVLDYYLLDDCRTLYGPQFVSTTNFCAGFLSRGGGACNHDVGGPGVIDGNLVGVVSFGSPVCGTPDAPTVFTKLGYYHHWINEIKEQDKPPPMGMPTTTQATRTWKPLWITEPVPTEPHPNEPIEASEETHSTTTSSTDTFTDFLKVVFDNIDVQNMIDDASKDNANKDHANKNHANKDHANKDHANKNIFEHKNVNEIENIQEMNAKLDNQLLFHINKPAVDCALRELRDQSKAEILKIRSSIASQDNLLRNGNNTEETTTIAESMHQSYKHKKKHHSLEGQEPVQDPLIYTDPLPVSVHKGTNTTTSTTIFDYDALDLSLEYDLESAEAATDSSLSIPLNSSLKIFPKLSLRQKANNVPKSSHLSLESSEYINEIEYLDNGTKTEPNIYENLSGDNIPYAHDLRLSRKSEKNKLVKVLPESNNIYLSDDNSEIDNVTKTNLDNDEISNQSGDVPDADGLKVKSHSEYQSTPNLNSEVTSTIDDMNDTYVDNDNSRDELTFDVTHNVLDVT